MNKPNVGAEQNLSLEPYEPVYKVGLPYVSPHQTQLINQSAKLRKIAEDYIGTLQILFT